jgi:lipoprotein-anchoring transpeptidase ErfK/SrfK
MDDQVRRNEQEVTGRNAPWTGWQALSQAGDQAKSLVVVPNQDGRLHAFMVGLDDQVRHNEQEVTGRNAPWTGWQALSQAGDQAKSVVVVPTNDGRLQAFVIGLG